MISAERLEQAAAYVLGAMDAPDVTAFETELAQSPELRREVEALRHVSAYLAMAAPAAAPPPRLRDRVLQQARASRPAPAEPLVRARPRMAVTILPWLAAAAALAGVVVMQQRYVGEREGRMALMGAADSMRLAIAARDSVLATLLALDVETARLVSTDRPPSARLYWNRSTSQIVLAAFSLPPAPRGRTYQLWGIAGAGSRPVSLGTFDTSPSGEGRLTGAVPVGVDITVGAVTEEPAGGSPQPTTQPFLVGEFRTSR
jgi:anti-sigma-K factor RskA